ncbi:cupin domain-containing protein [Chitinophaga parva]|uniref:Cupin domain-containing protein n=1 Tax=Chitinophaga parva TaxID=2169414 RepID=A0A2T7BIH4_9BACT|nr:cupin domain-containing protein [Chitinophaga parva]PUZ26091.1 cupin domain-containing protein [Chitinophaga parva]
MPESKIIQSENTIPWEDLGGGLSRQVYGYNDQLMMVKVRFEAGGIGTLHSHPHTQVTYVAAGRFEATIGEVKQLISAGDGFYVPPHVVHGVVCLEAGMLIDSFNPAREDFL